MNLVTGGAGFIGSHIAAQLLANGEKVRILDDFSTGKQSNLAAFKDDVEVIEGDLRDPAALERAVKGCQYVYQQAALRSVPRSIDDPLANNDVNVTGILNLLIASKRAGVQRVVYASSSSVYGSDVILPKVEENVGEVLSPYAATKAIDEIYAGVFVKCYGMECIGMRYFNIFGPRQDPNGAYAAVIPKFIEQMKSGAAPTIHGDGSFSRDFTYVSNAVRANLLGLTTTNAECFGQAFNIGAGGQTCLTTLVAVINSELKTNIRPIFGPPRPGDIPHSNADISKAGAMLGYEPVEQFLSGMTKVVDTFR